MAPDFTFERVLLVDGSDADRALQSTFLQQAGVKQIVEAGGATQGLNAIVNATHPFDAVIAETTLSDISGFRLLQVVRTNEVRPISADCCFILMSGDWAPEALSLARGLDASGVLLKPFAPTELKQQLSTARRRTFKIDIKRYQAIATP